MSAKHTICGKLKKMLQEVNAEHPEPLQPWVRASFFKYMHAQVDDSPVVFLKVTDAKVTQDFDLRAI